MRFVRLQIVALLRRCPCPLVSTHGKHQNTTFSTSFLTSTTCSKLPTTRSLSNSWTARKDAPLRTDELDLDVWKSVMRAQASQKEKSKDGDEESTLVENKEDSLIEMSRQLVEMWRQAGKLVPENITDEQLETLAELTTKSSKKKYLKYLSIKEDHKKANKEKKEKKKADRMAERNDEAERVDGAAESEDGEDSGEVKWKNTYLMHFWSRSMDRALGWRAAQAMQYGQQLVFDMSYEQHMSRREMENTVSQLLETEGWNRRSRDPFHFHFCHLQPEGAYQRELIKRYGQEAWDRLLITATRERYVDLFPHELLVYLTADSPNVLRTYDHNKVYIIGAMVDRSIQTGVSLANAKRLKLATARLPLDEYLHWDSGAKNLTLDQMIRIMMTAKETGSWEKALEFVPKRKHDGFHQQRKETGIKSKVKPRTFINTSNDPEDQQSQIFESKQSQKSQRQSDNSKPSFLSENNSGQSRLRIALKSKLEDRSKAKNKRNWWEEE